MKVHINQASPMLLSRLVYSSGTKSIPRSKDYSTFQLCYVGTRKFYLDPAACLAPSCTSKVCRSKEFLSMRTNKTHVFSFYGEEAATRNGMGSKII